MALQNSDLLLINRGGVNYKVTYETVLAGPTGQAGAVQNSDLIMVQRGGDLYKVALSTLRSSNSNANLSNTDYLLIERGGVQYAYQPVQIAGLAPELLLTLDPTGINATTTAFGIVARNARPYGSIPAQVRLPNGNIIFLGGSYTSVIIKAEDLTGGTAHILGEFDGLSFNGSRALTQLQVQSSSVWDAMFPNPGADMGSAMFYNCAKLTQVPPTIPLRSMRSMFYGCTVFNQSNIGSLDTSLVKSFSQSLRFCEAFDQDITSWDMANAEDLSYMFAGATAFSQSLNNWGPALGNVTNMNNTFAGSTAYNQPMNLWNVSSVTQMNSMFKSATIFDQNLSGWCVNNIASEPTDFSTDSALTPSNAPVWGTCP